MQPKVKRWLTMAVAGLLGVSIIAGSALALNGSLPNLFAETADSGGPLKADPVTLGSWTDLEDGEVWTDKSVYTDTLTLSDNEESIKLTPDEGNFGVGLSVLTAGGKSAVDGDVIFTEPLGRFMEVKEIDGLFYRDSYHTVDEFIAYFERASGEDRAKIEQLVSSRIQGIDGGELIDKAIEAGSFTHDANWIDWYENAQGTYVDDVRNAVARNRSYFFYGIQGVEAMNIEVRVRTDLDTNEQTLTYVVPQKFLPRVSEGKADSPLRLFYQVGVSDTYDFSNVPVDYEFQDTGSVEAFLSTRESKAYFTPASDNEFYRHFTKVQVDKAQNVTGTLEYVSLTDKMNGLYDVTVYHGNNGLVTVTKPGSVEMSVSFVPHDNGSDYFGDLTRFTYRLEFEAGSNGISDEYFVSTSQGKISLNEFGMADVNVFVGEPMIIYNVEPGTKITATCRTSEKDYELVNASATCSVHAGQRESLAFMVKYTGTVPEVTVPTPTISPDTAVEKPLETPPEYYDLTIRNELAGSTSVNRFEYDVLIQGNVSSLDTSNVKMPDGAQAPSMVKGTNSRKFHFSIGAGEQVVFDDILKGATYTVTQTTEHSDFVTTYTSNRTGTLNSDQVVTVTNTAVDAATYTIEVTSNLTGTTPYDDITFRYELQASHLLSNGSSREVQSIAYHKENGTQTVAFNPIVYTKAGVYSYSVVQVANDRTGSDWDRSVFDVTVTVERNGTQFVVTSETTRFIGRDGTSANGSTAGGVVFDNRFNAQTVTVAGFDVTMRLTGDAADYTGDFKFTIEPVDGAPYQGENRDVTISYDAKSYDSKVLFKSTKFDDIVFDKPGKYLYLVRLYDGTSVPGSNRNMDYNTLTYRVNVTVTSDDSGALKAKTNLEIWEYTGSHYEDTADRIMYFIAKYTKPEFGEVTQEFKLQSVIEGDAREGKTDLRYTIEPVENRTDEYGDVIHEDYPMPIDQSVVASHEGINTVKLTFGSALYSVPGTYTYLVKQKVGNIAGMEYDKSEYQITVVATNSEGTSTMSIKSVTYSRVVNSEGAKVKSERVGSIKFVNTYHPTDGLANVPFSLNLEGDNYNGAFEFEIVPEGDDVPMPGENVETLTFAGVGEINGRWAGYGQFDAIQYTSLGEYSYVVRQVQGRTPGMTYDKSEFRAVVTMIDEGGHLKPAYKYTRLKNSDGSVAGGNTEQAIQFNNYYNELTDVVVDVVWINDDTLDHPLYVDVQRYADNGVFGETVRLSTQNAWHYEWTDSDADPDWTVDIPADLVPEGFEKTVTREGNHFVITLDDVFPEGEYNRLSTIVVFEDEYGRTDKPENLQLLLRENGIIFGQALDVNEEHDWRYSWHGLREGQEYTVEVVDDVKGWDVDIANDGHNNVTITFRAQPIVPDPIDLTVNVSQDIQNGREPFDEVALQLYRDGEAYGDLLYVSDFNDWSYTWTQLDGAYDWTVDEPQVPEGFWRFVEYRNNGTVCNIINHDFPLPDEGKTVKVVKVWDNVPQWRFEPVGTPSSGDKETDEKYGLGIYGTLGDTVLEERPEMVPAEVLVQLKIGGAPVGEAVSLNDENGWQYTWKGLDDAYDYQVIEVTDLEQFETVARNDGDNWTITNKYVDKWYEELSLKILWNVSDASRIPDSVKVQLYRDGEPFGAPTEVTKSDGWTYKFEKLLRDHTYTVEQVADAAFVSEVTEDDGTWIITNRLAGSGDVSSEPDDIDNDRPGWNNPDDPSDDWNDGDDDTSGSGWGQGGAGSGDDGDDNSGGQADGNQNNLGTGIIAVPGDGAVSDVGSGIGVGVGTGTNSGSGTVSSGNGTTTTVTTGSGTTDNDALANPDKYATPNTGVSSNVGWLYGLLGVLAVAGIGIGVYFWMDKKKKEEL